MLQALVNTWEETAHETFPWLQLCAQANLRKQEFTTKSGLDSDRTHKSSVVCCYISVCVLSDTDSESFSSDTFPERFPLVELSSGDNTSGTTCFTTGLVWDLSVLPTLYLPTSQTAPSATPGPLDLSSPSSLSSSASSSGEEDEGRTSDPPSPEPVHTYAPRQRMKCTGVMAHVSPPEEEEREAPVTATRPAFLCKHCPKEYTSLGALKMHIRSHTLPCVCTTCGKAFSRPWLLRGHIRTHTGKAHVQRHSTTSHIWYICTWFRRKCVFQYNRRSALELSLWVTRSLPHRLVCDVSELNIHNNQLDEFSTWSADILT